MLLTGHKTRAIFDRYNSINEQELLEAGDQLVAYLAQHAQAAPLAAVRSTSRSHGAPARTSSASSRWWRGQPQSAAGVVTRPVIPRPAVGLARRARVTRAGWRTRSSDTSPSSEMAFASAEPANPPAEATHTATGGADGRHRHRLFNGN